jgi:hypothetical protein
MKVLVCGGRHYADRERLTTVLDRLRAERGFSLVIAGGARGADTLAEEWAKAAGLPCDVYRADWEGLGRKAGPIRNERMLHEGKPELVVGFPGGRGTAHMCRIAREAGVEVIEIADPLDEALAELSAQLLQLRTPEEIRAFFAREGGCRVSFELPRTRRRRRGR